MNAPLRLLLALGGMSASFAAHAETGVTPTEIKLGQSAAFTGPTSALGLGMRAGLQAAFAEINAAGGVNGRTISLVAKDDGYDPERAAANTHELISHDGVFLMIGGVGTPTALASVPLCDQAGVPFLAPFTGAIRGSHDPLVIHLRASYDQEIERLVHLLVDERKLSRIACLRQDDGYGRVGLNALEAALGRRNLKVVAVGTYERNTEETRAAVWEIKQAAPEAILMVGTYATCAKFVKSARKQGMDKTVFCTISFVGTHALIEAMGPADAEGVIVSQVVPDPALSSLPVSKAYAAALKSYDGSLQPDWISFEGYLAGRLFGEFARRSGNDLTRKSFLQATASTVPIDLGGFVLAYGPERQQGSDEVYLTRVHEGRVEPLP